MLSIDACGGDIGKILRAIELKFCELETKAQQMSFKELFNEAASLVHRLTCAIQYAQKNGWEKDDIRSELLNTWRIHSNSSFIKHIQTWPRGFPGDFEVINMIVDREEKTPTNTLGGMLGFIAVNSLITQQHREKLRIQSELIRHICNSVKSPNIVSIACGSSRDVERNLKEIKDSGAKILLIDFDKEALADSANRLQSVKDQVSILQTNVRRLPKLVQELAERNGKFHLIYAGGLFDYLPEGIIKLVLQKMSSDFIHKDGTLMFTNIKTGNPFQPWMEVMGNWSLIERSEEEMKDLLSCTKLPNQELSLEPTGLTWIAKAEQ